MKISELDKIAKIIVNCAFNVHKELGPGLLEKVYEICFCHELKKAGLEPRVAKIRILSKW